MNLLYYRPSKDYNIYIYIAPLFYHVHCCPKTLQRIHKSHVPKPHRLPDFFAFDRAISVGLFLRDLAELLSKDRSGSGVGQPTKKQYEQKYRRSK